MSRNVHLTVATTDYDHVRDLRLGDVRAEGIDLTWLTMDIHEIFTRFTLNRDWQVSELSFAKFISDATRADADIIGLPVYVSRMFRFSSFYVNRKAGIRTPADLAGKRIGISEWAQTATVYMRGWLQHEIGVPLTSIDWYQAGTEEAGRDEKVALNLPDGLHLTPVPDKTLSGMLASGELDAVMVARHRWLARALYDGFLRAKKNSLERLIFAGMSRYPLPWINAYVMRMRGVFGDDFWPYGLAANRPTLDAFFAHAGAQGLPPFTGAIDDLFDAAGTLTFD